MKRQTRLEESAQGVRFADQTTRSAILCRTRRLYLLPMADPFESAPPPSPSPSSPAVNFLHLSITSAILGICLLYYVALTLYTRNGSKVFQPFITLFWRKKKSAFPTAKVHNADQVDAMLGLSAGGDGANSGEGDLFYDAVVVGAGIAGSALAYSLGKVRVRSLTRI